jgi:hypothetical protein
MMRALLALAFTAAAVLSADARQRTVESYYFACKSAADLKAITEAVKKNDDDAFAVIAQRVFPENSCLLLNPLEVVQVVRTNRAGQSCIRRESESACFWTDKTAFRPNPEVEQWRRLRGEK